MSNLIDPALGKECSRLSIQLQQRYGVSLFRKMFGEQATYADQCAQGFLRSRIDAVGVAGVREWLIQGLKPFAEYPPSMEMMIQMARIMKSYPMTPEQVQYNDFWFSLDAQYSQGYGRFWKSDQVFEGLQKERVWLTAFTELQATLEELNQALKKIKGCTVFRNYPPTLDQFKDAVLAVRKNDAPLVEEAWLLALSIRPGEPLHPMIVKARSKISAFELNNNSRDRETEQRFKTSYLGLLKSEEEVYQEVMDSPSMDITYETPDTLLSVLQQMKIA